MKKASRGSNPGRRAAKNKPTLESGKNSAALYLYGISQIGASKPQAGALKSAGVDGIHTIEARACDGFFCWISEVDPVAFPRDMENNLENLEWLALHSVRHQTAVAEIAKNITIVPARFGAVFSSETVLFQDVLRRKSALVKVLARIDQADEWGVKLFAEAPAPPADVPAASSGLQYLRQKATRMKQRPPRNDAEIAQFAGSLERIAKASAPTGKVSGAQPNLLWQTTFLLPRSCRGEWDKTLRQFVKRWKGAYRIEVNGPWPPYSFAS